MRIWVNDKWYSPKDTLIVVELKDKDKENIKNMHPDCILYSEFEEDYITIEEVQKKLKELRDENES